MAVRIAAAGMLVLSYGMLAHGMHAQDEDLALGVGDADCVEAKKLVEKVREAKKQAEDTLSAAGGEQESRLQDLLNQRVSPKLNEIRLPLTAAQDKLCDRHHAILNAHAQTSEDPLQKPCSEEGGWHCANEALLQGSLDAALASPGLSEADKKELEADGKRWQMLAGDVHMDSSLFHYGVALIFTQMITLAQDMRLVFTDSACDCKDIKHTPAERLRLSSLSKWEDPLMTCHLEVTSCFGKMRKTLRQLSGEITEDDLRVAAEAIVKEFGPKLQEAVESWAGMHGASMTAEDMEGSACS